MEPIKITDKLTLRQEALRMAVMQATANDTPMYICNMAENFAAYIQDSAELPEYENANKHITDMLAKMQDSFKPNPWISADSEMKPIKGTEVLVMCKGSDTPKFGEYVGDGYWEVQDADISLLSKMGEVKVLAWMPIPPYVEPTAFGFIKQ